MTALKNNQNITSIPIIDISGLLDNDIQTHQNIASHIRKACLDKGFFYITGHGVSKALQDKVFEYSKLFFSLPPEQKKQWSIELSEANRGYEPLRAQTLEPDSPPDIKEGFYIGKERSPSDPFVIQKAFNQGPNQWPDIDGFKEVMEEYQVELIKVSERLMRAIALSLNLEADYFTEFCKDADLVTLRLLHYPPQPANAQPNEKGCGAHTDFGGLTLLLQDHNRGLQVWDQSTNQWIWAEPIEDSYVVNLGDLISMWTNNTYRSTLHRVINISGGERYSVPFFYSGNRQYQIECIRECLEENSEPLYPPISVEQHYRDMFKKTYI